MKTKLYLILLTLFNCHLLLGQCPNRSLHFDGGNQDYVLIDPSPIPSGSDFTVEFWYYSSSNSSSTSCTDEVLISLHSSPIGQSISLVDCNGDLFLDIISGTCSSGRAIVSTSIRNAWNHVAITYQPGQLNVIHNCSIQHSNSTCAISSIDQIYLGAPASLASNSHFKGQLDEIRIWGAALSDATVCARRKCAIPTNVSNLIARYPCDQGVAGDPAFPANDNTSISDLIDVSGGIANYGVLNNFSRIGQTSNFICSSSPMLYPDEYDIVLQDYIRSMPIDHICNGDPFHICLQDTSGAVVGVDPNRTILWEYNNGSGWDTIKLTSFVGTCFAVAPGDLTIDCSLNTTGSEVWAIRTSQQIFDGTDTCTYAMGLDTLTICCDISPFGISITPTHPAAPATPYPGGLLCEEDTVRFDVSHSSPYPFLINPTGDVTIDWTYIERGSRQPLPAQQNQNSFSLNAGVLPPGSYCFEAAVSSCDSNKSMTFQSCVEVTPMPVCDTIDAMEVVGDLTLIQTDTLVYEMCAGGAAKVLMTGSFLNCIPHWEYAFNTNFTPRYPLGTTNTQINTNIVPTSMWPPGADRIYYRVACSPLANPSGCDTCWSNIVGIEITDRLAQPQIVAPDTVCFDGTSTWAVLNPDTSLTYTWICDGIHMGHDTAISLPGSIRCCYLEASNACETTTSTRTCASACSPIAAISCPLAPNACPAVGDTISLTACGSASNCGPLTYAWSWDSGTLVQTQGCDISHVPAPGGTTYSVTVTDDFGCQATTSRTIVPCP